MKPIPFNKTCYKTVVVEEDITDDVISSIELRIKKSLKCIAIFKRELLEAHVNGASNETFVVLEDKLARALLRLQMSEQLLYEVKEGYRGEVEE